MGSCLQKVEREASSGLLYLLGGFCIQGGGLVSQAEIKPYSDHRVSEVALEMPRKVFLSFRGYEFVKGLNRTAPIYTVEIDFFGKKSHFPEVELPQVLGQLHIQT